ncbi:hypothetical protein TKK_0000627 [Trichogramma kaykai]
MKLCIRTSYASIARYACLNASILACELLYGAVPVNLSVEQALRIKRCMHAAMCFFTGLEKWQYIIPKYVKFNILPYENGNPDYWSKEFEFREAPASHSSRMDELELVIVRANTDCARYSFTIGAAHLWNGLSYNIRRSLRTLSFKKLLRQHLLEV